MASKTGSFLGTSDRQKILRDLQRKGELTPGSAPEAVRKEAAEVIKNHYANNTIEAEPFGTGCLACGADDDHANLLLCEACNAEYHTYCLEPPLRSVPAGEWYCPECKASIEHLDEDGLDKLVNALSPCFTSRFGEVCWAQGGQGFGWWPAFIYDPRLTVDAARQLARKNLGKRHLVYFFECHDAPFSVLTTTKITKWDVGLIEDFHLGKTARSAGQKRTKSFKQALQAATIEAQKPIEMRMDWNHSDQPHILPPPENTKVPQPRKRSKRKLSPVKGLPVETIAKPSSKRNPRSKPRGFPLMTIEQIEEMDQVPTRRNLNQALGCLARAAKNGFGGVISPIVELVEDGELFVKLLHKQSLPVEDLAGKPLPAFKSSDSSNIPCKNVGFLTLASRKSSTFLDARVAINRDLVKDTFASDVEWRFFVPGLGPVSSQQETKLGAIYSFLRRTTLDKNLGDGTLLNPLKVFVIELQATAASSTLCSASTPS